MILSDTIYHIMLCIYIYKHENYSLWKKKEKAKMGPEYLKIG